MKLPNIGLKEIGFIKEEHVTYKRVKYKKSVLSS
jgi:hypothetical protein